MPTTDIVPDTVRMSHRHDPGTSRDAAVRASSGTKKSALYKAIATVLRDGPLTPKEVHREYGHVRMQRGWPVADLQDIRRRMTELEHDFDRIEPVGRRNGERVMRLVGEAVA